MYVHHQNSLYQISNVCSPPKSDLIIIIPKCNGDIYKDDNDQRTIDETNNE